MSARNLHPGRELVRCSVHTHSFYPRAAGCSICRMQRRAEQLATERSIGQLLDEHDRRHQIDNGPAARGSSPPAPCSEARATANESRVAAAGPASTPRPCDNCGAHWAVGASRPDGSACDYHIGRTPASIEPWPLAELVARHDKLIQRAAATVASIDRALSDDEQRRKNSHEAAALAEVGRALFNELCGPQSRVVNSGFELECIPGGVS